MDTKRLETIKEMDRLFNSLVESANRIAKEFFLKGKKHNYQALDKEDFIELKNWIDLLKTNKKAFNKLKKEAKALKLALPFFNMILNENRWV